MNKSYQNIALPSLGILSLVFVTWFFLTGLHGNELDFGLIKFGLDRFSLFTGGIFCVSLFVGLFPVRKEIPLSRAFLFYLIAGVGTVFSNNLLTFFLFWCFQRSIPLLSFTKGFMRQEASGGGTYILQHIFTFFCFIGLLIHASQSGLLTVPFSDIHAPFFTWPVLILSFIIIYESHGIFPFHSWVHDVVGHLPWYEISSLFLTRAGVVLFVKFLLPTLNQDPDTFQNLLLSLSIFSSIYWTFRGIHETNVAKITTYFYVAQTSLVLTGLQANVTSVKGAYLHMMVISLSGTAMWSILSYVQHYFSIKRLNQFYGLAQYHPKLATLFCLFGFCMIGVPLGASFVVEDLVITGLLENQPFLGLGHILATGLNGILFFLVFTKLFQGQSAFKQPVRNMDMPLRRMVPYVLVLVVMISIGVMPSLFLENLKW